MVRGFPGNVKSERGVSPQSASGKFVGPGCGLENLNEFCIQMTKGEEFMRVEGEMHPSQVS